MLFPISERQRGAADWSGMEDPAAPGAGSPPTNGNGNGGGKGKPAAPKGREAFRSQRRESEVRSPEGFQLGPGDTRGGKRWLRCFGRVPRRALSRSAKRAPAGPTAA